MKFKVPKRHILRPTLSTDMVQWVCSRRGKRSALAEKRQGAHDKEMMNFLEKRR
jgi:hypothetical protein